eukprot:m.478648 g.478648  ORF g.478648 m.478648 type:complete len:336 (+) comp21191_c0_seq1:215-1222(+)
MAALALLPRLCGRGALVARQAAGAAAWVPSSRGLAVQAEPAEGDELPTLVEQFRSHPLCFRNFPIEDIQFAVGEHFVSKKPHPHVYKNSECLEDGRQGLHHVTPLGVSIFSYFGPNGNLGKEMHFPSGTQKVTDLAKAEQEVYVTSKPLPGSEAVNMEMRDYFDWLQQVQDKYLQHLTESYNEYPALERKFANYPTKDPVMLAELMGVDMSGAVKHLKSPEGDASTDEQFIGFKQRMYFPNGGIDPVTEGDFQMKGLGLRRRHVPLYNRLGEEVPIEQATLNPMDVVAVECNITCNLWEIGRNVGYGLRRNLRSVTVVQSRKPAGSDAGPPLGNF